MTEQHLEAVVGQIQDLIMNQVTPNVTLATYGSAPVPPANLPAMILYVPLLKRVRLEHDNEPEQVIDTTTGVVTRWRPPRYYDLIFRYELLGEPLPVLQLGENMARMFGTYPSVTVDRTARGGGTETVQYRLEEAADMEAVRAPEAGQYHPLSGTFAVRMVAVRAAAETSTITPSASALTLTFERKEN